MKIAIVDQTINAKIHVVIHEHVDINCVVLVINCVDQATNAAPQSMNVIYQNFVMLQLVTVHLTFTIQIQLNATGIIYVSTERVTLKIITICYVEMVLLISMKIAIVDQTMNAKMHVVIQKFANLNRMELARREFVVICRNVNRIHRT